MKTVKLSLFKQYEMLLRLLLPYLCMLILFLPLTLVISNRLLDSAVQYAADIGQKELDRTTDLLDQRLSELKDLGYALANDPAVKTVGNLPGELQPADYIKLMELNDDIVRYYQSSDYVQGLSLWFEKSRVARIATTFLTSDHETYQAQYQYNGVDYESFFSAFCQSGALDKLVRVSAVQGSGQKEMLLYCVNLDLLSGGNQHICAFFEINLEQIASLFQFFEERYGGGLQLCDIEGEVLWSCGDTQLFTDAPSGEPHLHINGLLSFYSPQTMFNCQMLAPVSQISRGAESLKWGLVWINTIVVLFSVLISVFFAYRYARPLQKTIDALESSQSPASRRRLENLYQSVETLISSEKQLSGALSQERELRRMGLFSSLLFRTSPLPEEMLREQSISLDLDLSAPFFTAVYCTAQINLPDCPENGKDQLAVQAILSQLLSASLFRAVPGALYLYKHQEGGYTLVTGLPDENRQNLAVILQKQAAELQEQYALSLSCCIGMPVSSLGMIAESFQLARFVMEQSLGDDPVQLVEKKDYPQQWEFTASAENAIIQNCLAGNVQQTEELVDKIFTSIGDNSPANLQQLIYSFRGTILRILSNFSGQNMSPIMAGSQHLTGCKNFDELHDRLRRILRSICLLIQNEKNSRQEVLFQKVMAYIADHYADPSLSLTSTADAFHLNEKYLSHFFKDASGVNFSAMVEKIRMEKIIYYMKETDCPISDICIRCGYSSSNSFYKAFKRIYGVSPNTYRQQLN